MRIGERNVLQKQSKMKMSGGGDKIGVSNECRFALEGRLKRADRKDRGALEVLAHTKFMALEKTTAIIAVR